MIASAQTIRRLRPITPFYERTTAHGLTFGLGPAGYDIRCAEEVLINAGGFSLASSVEQFWMPNNLLGIVHDKSTWARLGICVQNTVIEPGWRGWLTIELTNHSREKLCIPPGAPIAQIVFHLLDEPTEMPYGGKYQDQKQGAQLALWEESR